MKKLLKKMKLYTIDDFIKQLDNRQKRKKTDSIGIKSADVGSNFKTWRRLKQRSLRMNLEKERLFRRDGFGENYALTTPLVF